MEPRPAPHRILSLSVIGGFLDGLELSFGPGLNTIIGARRTGKTTAVEFIGYAFDSLPSREHAADERKRIETLVKRNLGGGRICVGILGSDGARYNVTRSFGDEPIVLDANEQPVSLSLKSGIFPAALPDHTLPPIIISTGPLQISQHDLHRSNRGWAHAASIHPLVAGNRHRPRHEHQPAGQRNDPSVTHKPPPPEPPQARAPGWFIFSHQGSGAMKFEKRTPKNGGGGGPLLSFETCGSGRSADGVTVGFPGVTEVRHREVSSSLRRQKIAY